MSKNEKKGETKIGAVIVLIISALVFLPAGGAVVYQSIFNRSKNDSYGAFNGKKIKYEPGSSFFNTAANLAQEYQQRGGQINEMANFYLLNNAFERTILNMAFSEAVKKSGYSVPKDAINRAILPYFYDENGKFSQKKYNQTDKARLSNIREDAKSELIYRRYANDHFGIPDAMNVKLYGIKTCENEKSFIAKMGAKKHSFEIATFDTADYPKEEAAIFGKENSSKFVKYDFLAITVEEENEATSLLKRINSQELSFEDAIAENSQKYYTDSEGKVISSFKYQIAQMLDNEADLDKILNLTFGESAIVKTMRGYTIFKAGEKKCEEPDFENEEILDSVLSYMRANEMGTIEEFFINKAEQFATNAAISSFDEACEEFDVQKSEIPAFPLNYGNANFYSKTTSELPALATNKMAYKTAFSLKIEEISSPVILGSQVVVFKCTNIEEDEEDAQGAQTAIYSVDQDSIILTIMASDKVENNFNETYLQQMQNQ